MARLALEAAPAVALPRRFLETSPCWGLLAGALLLLGGGAPPHSRWHPTVLAAAHAFALGVLGNLLFGSLLQFLPAAAGVRLRAVAYGGKASHALLNLGAALLAAGLYSSRFVLLPPAAVLLVAAFALLAAMTLPGLVAARGQRLLRAGLVAALLAALATASGGAWLALQASGLVASHPALPALVDVHAAWGLVGWMLLTLAAVGRVVLPMFQGTATPPARLQGIWTAGIALALPAASLAWLTRGWGEPLRLLCAFAALAFALAVLWLQACARRARNAPLRGFWGAGAIASCAAATALLSGSGLLAGVLAAAVALPLLACGMQLEIAAFLGWIDLHRRCGRGRQLPGVQRLLPDAAKWWVLGGQLVVAGALASMVVYPSIVAVRAAGLALLLAYALVGRALIGVRRRASAFLAETAA